MKFILPKPLFSLFVLLQTGSNASAQYSVIKYSGSYFSTDPIRQVDSMAVSKNTARYFADIYRRSMKNIGLELQNMDSASKAFILKFEIRFAGYFMAACISEENGLLSPASPWKTFFSIPDAKPWQSVLIGVNAHINADFRHVLLDEFSEEEISTHKKALIQLHGAIAKQYDALFADILKDNGYLRFMNTISIGLEKKYGKHLLAKWRKRQIRLALLYYRHPQKYIRRDAAIRKKKIKIDERILRG